MKSISPSAGASPVGSVQAVNVACALMVVMAPVMWAANRSATLVLVLAAAVLLARDAAGGRAWALLSALRAAVARPVPILLLAFLLWSLVSLSWSHRPWPGLAMYGELVLPLVAGLVLGVAWPRTTPVWAFQALAVALILAGLLIAAELWAGPWLRDALGRRSQSYIFNRPLLACVMLMAPVLQALWSRTERLDRGLALLVVACVVGAVLAGESGAAELGLIVLIATWIAARLLPRLVLAVVALVFAATMLTAPLLGVMTDRAIPPQAHQQLSQAHSRERVDIWLSFGEAIRARPVIGSGFGASVAMGTHPVAASVSEPRRLMLDVGHPHSAPVQAWVETGAIGAVLLMAAGLVFLSRLRHLSPPALAPRLAAFACAFGVACVGHGAWQGWWIAILAATAIWFSALRPSPSETRP